MDPLRSRVPQGQGDFFGSGALVPFQAESVVGHDVQVSGLVRNRDAGPLAEIAAVALQGDAPPRITMEAFLLFPSLPPFPQAEEGATLPFPPCLGASLGLAAGGWYVYVAEQVGCEPSRNGDFPL